MSRKAKEHLQVIFLKVFFSVKQLIHIFHSPFGSLIRIPLYAKGFSVG